MVKTSILRLAISTEMKGKCKCITAFETYFFNNPTLVQGEWSQIQ
jgi:hypothetical protein